jgi:hypothetical protein
MARMRVSSPSSVAPGAMRRDQGPLQIKIKGGFV